MGTRFYTWHITVDDHPQLRALVRACQEVLRPLPNIDVVPERWLHMTVQGLGHTREVAEEERDDIVDAVRARLSRVEPPTVTFHRAVIHPEAVVVPPADPEPLLKIRRAIRDGIADVWGATHVPEAADGFRPHVSAAYINAPGESTAVRAALDQAGVRAISETLTAVSLIVRHRDHRMYEWTTIDVPPIGPRAPRGR